MPVIGIYVSKEDEQTILEFRTRLRAARLSFSRWILHQIKTHGNDPITLTFDLEAPAHPLDKD